MKYFKLTIALLFCTILGFGQTEITFNNDAAKAQLIDISTVDNSVLEASHLLTNTSGGSKLFLDDKAQIIYTPSKLNINSSSYDSVFVEIDNRILKSSEFKSILITGLDKGEHSISYSFQKDGKEVEFENINNSIDYNLIESTPWIKNDAIVLGLLILFLALIFYTGELKSFKRFYTIIPGLLLCYVIPATLNSLGIISGEYSSLYFVASRYLLPASLILLCLSIDLGEIKKLGSKAVIMFFAGTIGIVIGGPVALFIIAGLFPDALGADASELWKGLATVAGSWIGGGANQTAMKEIYQTPNDIFSKMLVVDIFVANVWMAILLFGVGKSKKIDKYFKADTTAIDRLKTKMEHFSASVSKIPSKTDLMVIIAIGITGMGLSHFLSDTVTPFFKSIKDTLTAYNLTSLASGFFWLIVFATVIGVALSFTKLKNMEGAGASKIGSIFLYILVATIGTHMDIGALFDSPIYFAIGFIWMAIHAIILLGVAKIIKAPFFFIAVGSQANVGGAASAPVVASEFSPTLAPVGVLLAVLGYAVGTVGAIICAQLMSAVDIG